MKLQANAVRVAIGGDVLLDDVTASFPAGALTVLVGENGAGKSTLLDRLAGIARCDRGNVLLDGVDVATLATRARARRIASLGQHEPQTADLSVEARIGQGLVPRRGADALLDDDARARIHRVAASLGVAELLARRTGSLSSGERRRVHLARALVDDEADVILVDEPHAGVDVRQQALVSAALRARAAAGACVVASVHDLAVALDLGTRALGLRDGRVVVAGPVEESLDARGIEAIYGVAGAVVVRDGGRIGVLLPR